MYSKSCKNFPYHCGIVLNTMSVQNGHVYRNAFHTHTSDECMGVKFLWDKAKELLGQKYEDKYLYESVVLVRGTRRYVFTR